MTTLARKTVLCVDDDDAVQRLISDMLATEYKVVAVPTAEQALDRVAKGESFDVLLIDLMLPGMSGQELFDVLKRKRPDLAGRVAFTSSAAVMVDPKGVPRSFAIRYLKKPFDRAELLAFVRRVLRVTEPGSR